LVNDADFDINNEIQDLNLTGDILTITNNAGATDIDLSDYRETVVGTGDISVVDDGNGNYTVNYVDGDNDDQNEIELPTGGNIGQVLSTDGSGTYTWVDPDSGAAGADGEGFTGGSYDAGSGVVTFTSDDGLGFVTGDLRGADGADGEGFTGGSYDAGSGVVTFTSDDGLGFVTGDLRGADGADGATGAPGAPGAPGAAGADGEGFTGGSYNASTGVVTFTSDDGLGFVTGDLRGADGADGAPGATGPAGDPATDDQTLATTGAAGQISITGGNAITLNVNDADSNASNELQTISRSGTNVILSNGGGTVSIADNDNNSSNEIQTITSTDGSVTVTPNGINYNLSVPTANGAETIVEAAPDTDISVTGTGTSADPYLIANTRPDIFYPPSIEVDVATTGTGRTIDLHAEYLAQYGTPAVVSAGAPTAIPTYANNELYYYVTYYDTTVFANVSVNATGIMTYDVIAAPTDYNTLINVVFVAQ
ncbi:hypothetical protein PXC01_12305, partial [Maribacter sp. M208]|uniref:hypothetical protein n=1 Tax=Maribacter huludaoensis TaxID=3030010 RepID=UPI0023EBD5EC